jgi:single-stranded-DNA-specific exonuclease
VALDLLLETNPELAQAKAENLEEINKRRQDITARIMSEAREKALTVQHRKVLVLMSEGWHKGVVGLVAGKIAEEFYKPTIVLEQGEVEATGSARTVGEFDVVEALKYSSTHLLRFGGHKQAAGLTLAVANFENFYKSLLEFAENKIDEDASPALHLDAELTPQDLQLTTYNLLTKLEPYGVGNPKPKFLLKNCLIGSFRLVGKEKQHLQMQLQIGDRFISSVAFNFGNRAQTLQTNATIDIACELMKDVWNGEEQLKLRIVDIKVI